MTLPFTPAEFMDGFARFNATVWPLQVVTLALAAAIVLLARRGGTLASRAASLGLATLWISAAALQGIGMYPVMTTAVPFALLFLVEAALLAAAGLMKRLSFRVRRGTPAAIGLSLVAYAAVVYPAIGFVVGETWPRTPLLGVAPCPNTIFTWGVLLLTERPVPRWVLVIPILWSIVGISAAAFLGVPQDWGLPVAAVVATVTLTVRDRAANVHRLAHA